MGKRITFTEIAISRFLLHLGIKTDNHNKYVDTKNFINRTVGTGLIVSYPTGIQISKQVGGSACIHPFLEGFYLPVCNDYSIPDLKFMGPEIELNEYFTGEKYGGHGATDGIDQQDAEYISQILAKYNVQDFIVVNREKLRESHETWIYVIIHPDRDNGLIDYFGQTLKGVLTWSNSD